MLHILTLNLNGNKYLADLHSSLQMNLKKTEYTWHIKDNNSSDESITTIKNFNNNNINLVEYKNNLQNFSQGCNLLFEQAQTKDTDLILLLNNDVKFINQHSITKMTNLLLSNKNIGVVGAKLLFMGSNKLQHAGVIFGHRKLPFHFKCNEIQTATSTCNREFQCVTGAVLLMRAGDYKQIHYNSATKTHGLDEYFHWAFDDVDLCLAVKYKLNKKIIYCGETEIYHEESATLKKSPTNMLFMNHNVSRLLNKWGTKIIVDAHQYQNNANYKVYTG